MSGIRKAGVVIVGLCLTLWLAVPGLAQEAGRTNWYRGYIEAKAKGFSNPNTCIHVGHCRSMAERAATVEARANLLKLIEKIHITSETDVVDAILKGSITRQRVRATIRGARKVGQTIFQEFPPGSKNAQAEVTMRLPIYGALTRELLKQEIQKPPPPPRKVYRPKVFTVKLPPPSPVTPPPPVIPPEPKADPKTPPKPEPLPVDSPPTPPSPAAVYTGLIADATGLGAEPATVPKLRTPDLKEIYGPHLVDREVALNFGLAGYAETEQAAQKDHRSRIGESPLVVKGVKAHGTRRADIVVSDEDSQRIVLADLKGKFLRKAKVVIVIR